MHGWHLTRGLLVFLATLLLVGTACGGGSPAVIVEPVSSPTVDPSAQPTTTVTPEPSDTPTPAPEPTPYDGEVVAMRLPSIEVEAPIELIGLVEGRNQLDAPGPHTIGWYHIYDKPGFGTSSLFSAHKDYFPNIRGPFYALTELEPGDEIIVIMDDGREYVYEVFLQRRYEVDAFPTGDLIWPHKARDPELLRPADEEWITLITCGGDFVATTEGGAGRYLQRDVVIARLVEQRIPEAPA